jgi:hypothetical protein
MHAWRATRPALKSAPSGPTASSTTRRASGTSRWAWKRSTRIRRVEIIPQSVCPRCMTSPPAAPTQESATAAGLAPMAPTSRRRSRRAASTRGSARRPDHRRRRNFPMPQRLARDVSPASPTLSILAQRNRRRLCRRDGAGAEFRCHRQWRGRAHRGDAPGGVRGASGGSLIRDGLQHCDARVHERRHRHRRRHTRRTCVLHRSGLGVCLTLYGALPDSQHRFAPAACAWHAKIRCHGRPGFRYCVPNARRPLSGTPARPDSQESPPQPCP